ncbi:protein arginine methyltransferase 3 [Wolffia australiana]
MAAWESSGVDRHVLSEKMTLLGEGSQDEDEDEEEQVEAWDDWAADEDDPESSFLCLFCEAVFQSNDAVFAHCCAEHSFDFNEIKKNLKLDFYGCVKLINYIRTQVSKNRSWSWDSSMEWNDDIYLKPFMPDDALLESLFFDDNEEEISNIVDKQDLMRELMCGESISRIDNIDEAMGFLSFDDDPVNVDEVKVDQATSGNGFTDSRVQETEIQGEGKSQISFKEKRSGVHFSNASARNIKTVNEDYFGSYSSFGIHREMISDKVRTETYRDAMLNNPALMNGATVMDVGCGTGILSLFAAQAGASTVVAVDASKKMTEVATQIFKDNGIFLERSHNGDPSARNGIISVVRGMIEDLDSVMNIPPNSVDVLVSEWMGYCLLYESMLSSVIYARDRWLKPGGAILPDIATIFVAGFGKGATSYPFWEDVYGFDMSTIGREVLQDAAKFPIVDVIDSHDIVTETATLKSFDLATMKREEMDFTSEIELRPKNNLLKTLVDPKYGGSWCYGVVLWFDTPFSSRFCKEKEYTLSTSPYSPRTHWFQTIFTFTEPIALAYDAAVDSSAPVGTERSPASKIVSRMSIARAMTHRSIDISLEVTAVSSDGQRRTLPVQIFNL